MFIHAHFIILQRSAATGLLARSGRDKSPSLPGCVPILLRCVYCGTRSDPHDIHDNVAFVDAVRYLWAICPKKDTYLHGEKKKKEEEE